MLDHTLEDELIAELQRLHAAEERELQRLESTLLVHEDEALVADCRRLSEEGREQVELLAGCLSAAGETPGPPEDDDAVVAVGPSDRDGALRDVHRAARAGIVAYETLERLAERAGDEETAEVARTIRGQRAATVARLERRPDDLGDQGPAERERRREAA